MFTKNWNWLFAVGMVALAVPAQATTTTIVSDTFTRDDGALAGSTPAPVSGPGTWNTTNAWNITSGEAASPAGEGSAFIPIGHVTSGNTYTFTVQARNGGSWYWAGLAFADTNTSTYIPAAGVYGLRMNSGELQIWKNGDYKGSAAYADFTVNNQFKLVLDTTSGSAWTIGYFLNGSETPFYTMTVAPSLDINYVMLNSNNGGGTTSIFDNVLVTVDGGTPLVPTATTVVSSNYTTTFGDPVTFTATIVPTPDSGAFPAGNVQFKLDGTNLELVPVTVGVPTSHGTAATTSITTIPVGSAHVVTAEYIPATGFLTSTGTLNPNQTVLIRPGTTTTTVASSQNPSAFAAPVTFTATIVSYPDSGPFPAGHVQFTLDGTTDLGLVAVTQVGSTSHGTAATTSITTIPAGSAHVVTAEYIPTTGSGFFTSTGTLSPNQIVLPIGTAVIVSDTFTRADSDLNGSSPEIGPGPWNTTHTGWNVVSGAVTSGGYSAFVPIGTVTSGKIYTASADMTGAPYWILLGFSDVNTAIDVEKGIVWRTDGNQGQLFSDGNYVAGTGGSSFAKHNYSMVLDTTNPVAWNEKVIVDGVTLSDHAVTPQLAFQYAVFNGAGMILDNVLVTVAGGAVSNPYDTWAHAHAGDGAPSDDYNNDGVSNGIAYFMGMDGLATNPGVENGKVTWPHVGVVTSFEVQVSDNLQDWSAATTGVDTSDLTKVVYTLPTGAAKKFCRLLVIP